jgi:hypothetical protein
MIDLQPDIFGGLPRSKYLRRVWARSRDRARKSEILFTLEPEDVVRMYREQNGRCDVTGTTFNFERFDDAFVKHPFAPSIDRRISTGGQGYTPENVRLVCVAVNFGMGQWGQELYMKLARAAVTRETKEQTNPDPSGDADWRVRQREKIAAAEALRDSSPDAEQPLLRRRIAALKRNLTLGPEGLRRAAAAAQDSRRRGR